MSSPNPDVEIQCFGTILTPMVFGGGAFGWRLGHEDGAPINGISVLIKGIPEGSLTLSSM